jgi:hypothetical protein
MRMTIIGIEGSEGVSKKGQAYAIGRVHTTANLAPPMPGQTAKGQIGTTYDADLNLVKGIAHLPFPVVAEVTTEAVVRFGERREVITDIKPAHTERKAA